MKSAGLQFSLATSLALLMPGLAELARAKQVEASGSFTLYYVAEVTPQASEGIAGKVQTADGKWETYRLSPEDTKAANMQGTVVVNDADGKKTIVSIAKVGEWSDLPEGWHGKGNRMNPLTPYRTVAADQNHHPYGSRIFISDVEGFETPEGEVLDGYFWVADVGGGIKGANRFDVFVGTGSAYLTIMKQPGGGGKWNAPIRVENLPVISGEFNPKTDSGVKRILEGLGYSPDTQIAGKDTSERKAEGPTTAEMLTDFQQQHPPIPEEEYGSRRGAITLWYLTAAAQALQKGETYPVTPGAGSKAEPAAKQGDSQ